MLHFSPRACSAVILVLGGILSIGATESVVPLQSDGSLALRNIDTNAARSSKDLDQVLTVPLRRVDHHGVSTPSLRKRFFKTDVLGIYGAAYLAELEIGSTRDGGKQFVDVLIDTGSFELWVNPVCSASNMPELCDSFGHYDPELSTTGRKVDDDGFKITYGAGTVTGAYYRDDLYVSGVKIDEQQFGVADSSGVVWFGIMGLGHGISRGAVRYPLIIDSLADMGMTNTKLFSLDLGGQVRPGVAITGEMAFGGVDTNKYAGLLEKVPTDPSDPHYKVTLNMLALRTPGSETAEPLSDSSLPLPVIIDSGTTLSLLPEPLVTKLAAQFPGAEYDGKGGYSVDCAYQGQDGSVDFEFLGEDGTVTINVAYSDFIWNSGGGECFLGAWYTEDVGVWILGDTFLRGAYVAFDQTNNALFMSNYVSCGGKRSKLVAVPPGKDAAGDILGACPELYEPSDPEIWRTCTEKSTITSLELPPSSTLNSIRPGNFTTIFPRPSSAGSTKLIPSHKPNGVPHGTPGQRIPNETAAPTPCSGSGNREHTTSEVLFPTSNHEPDVLRVMSTLTSTITITQAIVYTLTTCPESKTNCPVHKQVKTRFETITTTFCPGHESPVPTKAGYVAITASTPSHTAVSGTEDAGVSSIFEKGSIIVTATATRSATAIRGITSLNSPSSTLDASPTNVLAVGETGHVQSPALSPNAHRNVTSTRSGNNAVYTGPVIAGAGRLDLQHLSVIFTGLLCFLISF
ncbi:aspartic peptidase domain-containing protein [Xylaria sp. CBS 124048]|nr:aspartic peptidase domain-containing protein [Xylaria sp. CBS 124048]